jgi:propanediol dehydratase large subunit
VGGGGEGVWCGAGVLAIVGNAVHKKGRLFFYCALTENKAFRVAYSAVGQSENVCSMGTTKLSFTSESCACSSIAFLAGTVH